MGIVHDIRLQELRLFTDYGRCCRPLFIVADQRLKVRKADIRQLAEAENREEAWQVRAALPLLLLTC